MINNDIDIDELILKIRDDFTKGCSTIVRNSIPIIEKIYSISDELERDKYLKNLTITKPSMPAIWNIVDYTRKNIGDNEDEFFRNLIKDVNMASRQVVDMAIQYLSGREGLKIVTVSYSSRVIEVLNSLSCSLKVFAVESNWNGISYGENLRKELNNCIISHVIPDCEIYNLIDGIDYVLIGCDGFNDRSIMNGTPSGRITEIYNNKAKIICLAESYKRSENLFVEDGFDIVPVELIDKVISDRIFS